METDILIIGGGLSGLSLASQLKDAGLDWQLLEARERWGGRILSCREGSSNYDLGPAWFWLGQPRIAALLQALDLRSFEQAYHGDLLFEQQGGDVHRVKGFASMQGSWRVEGGFAGVIDGLVSRLPDNRLHLAQSAQYLTATDTHIEVSTRSGTKIQAKQVALALPPRLASALTFSPALGQNAITAACAIPTWMAGHAKALAIYDNAFWKGEGLSGDAQSQQGPLVEIHDASPADQNGAALFGFIGPPPQARHDNESALKKVIKLQLGNLFGSDGEKPTKLIIQDWAFESETATALDQNPLGYHPAYGCPPALKNLWNNRLHFASTEIAPQFGGYIEGALEASQIVFTALTK